MQLTVTIELDNASYQEDSGKEISRKLACLFRECQRRHPPVAMAQAIRDTSGDTVGKFLIKESDQNV